MMKKSRRKSRKILDVAAVAVNVLLFAVTVFCAYGGKIDPAATPLGALAAMVFPVALAVTAVMLVLNLVFYRRLALVSVASVIVCWEPFVTYCPLNFFRPDVESVARAGRYVVKVMSYNMFLLTDITGDADKQYNATLEYILEQDADIVLCQESLPEFRPGVCHISGDQCDRLAELYPYRFVDGRGMGILSKHPFQEVKVEREPDWNFDVCRYDVMVDSVPLHLFNLHLQSIGLTSSDKELYVKITEGKADSGISEIKTDLLSKLSAAFRERAKQADIVRRAVEQVDGTVLLCGDFNDIPGCYASRVIAGDDMSDAYRDAGLGPAITYHADRFYFRIDQMFYRGAVKPLKVWRGDCASSDHYPLLAVMELLP